MGLFNGRKFNSTYFDLTGDRSLPQELVTGLVNKTIEVLDSHGCKIDPGTEKGSNGRLEYQLIGGGKLAFMTMIGSRLDITLDSSISKSDFETIKAEIEQYPASLGLVPKRDYYGLTNCYNK